MAILNKQQILEAPDIKKELVAVPEWGGEVYVKGMSGSERDNFEAAIIERRGKATRVNLKNIRARLAAACICDEQGNPLFTPADVEDLADKSAAALGRVYDVASRLSGIGEADIDELADGLKSDPFGDSPSD
jgi:hypothetical protein